ncbi:hypothetical protein ElyMa_001758500 [Elysia marginata]|uniref:PH domain-containing protein n=1 Tax=Elysia marginata TaxID=1093978 RepID=A0AAV4EBG3_9GAST|nr:hypothetical protein ElyMa_001758500 [Elysia marginata]
MKTKKEEEEEEWEAALHQFKQAPQNSPTAHCAAESPGEVLLAAGNKVKDGCDARLPDLDNCTPLYAIG